MHKASSILTLQSQVTKPILGPVAVSICWIRYYSPQIQVLLKTTSVGKFFKDTCPSEGHALKEIFHFPRNILISLYRHTDDNTPNS